MVGGRHGLQPSLVQRRRRVSYSLSIRAFPFQAWHSSAMGFSHSQESPLTVAAKESSGEESNVLAVKRCQSACVGAERSVEESKAWEGKREGFACVIAWTVHHHREKESVLA